MLPNQNRPPDQAVGSFAGTEIGNASNLLFMLNLMQDNFWIKEIA
jgi:hypothetical protein